MTDQTTARVMILADDNVTTFDLHEVTPWTREVFRDDVKVGEVRTVTTGKRIELALVDWTVEPPMTVAALPLDAETHADTVVNRLLSIKDTRERLIALILSGHTGEDDSNEREAAAERADYYL